MRIILYLLSGFISCVSALGVSPICRVYPNGTVVSTYTHRRDEIKEMMSRNSATFLGPVRTTSRTPSSWKPFPRITNRKLWTTKDMVAGTSAIDTRQTDARKGHLFVYTLHSAAFFPTAGTPVTGARQVTVHVFAKRLDTFETKQQYIVISLAEDGQLEKSVREAFRGKDVNPYIYTVQPEFLVPEGKEHLFRNQRSSSLISIGTQRGFYPTVHKLIHNLQTNPSFCKKQRLVVLNKYFSPTFDIDWCRTRIRNVTMLHDFVEGDVRSEQHYDIDWVVDLQVTATPAQPIREIGAISDGYSFWESVLVFPLIAVFCIVLVLVLSLIFFGRREGQQWRDYKTPKEQLDEYVSVRQSQRHLRELSVQRQLLLMASDRDHSSPPYGVHSFLQPKYKSVGNGVDSVGRFSKSASKLNDNIDDVTDLLSGGSETIPVGKQTVAEAARQCGSSLHLYRNPLESETDEENENDSLDEKDVTGASHFDT
ncbi:hypothetical protein Aduo_019303 [Ancylostoma duodenale]